MSLWGLYHSGQQVSWGQVSMAAMSQWAAGQWCPCHYGGYVTVGSRSVVAMSLWGYVTVVSGSVVAMSLWGPCHCGQQVCSGHVTVVPLSQCAAGQ